MHKGVIVQAFLAQRCFKNTLSHHKCSQEKRTLSHIITYWTIHELESGKGVFLKKIIQHKINPWQLENKRSIDISWTLNVQEFNIDYSWMQRRHKEWHRLLSVRGECCTWSREKYVWVVRMLKEWNWNRLSRTYEWLITWQP